MKGKHLRLVGSKGALASAAPSESFIIDQCHTEIAQLSDISQQLWLKIDLRKPLPPALLIVLFFVLRKLPAEELNMTNTQSITLPSFAEWQPLITWLEQLPHVRSQLALMMTERDMQIDARIDITQITGYERGILVSMVSVIEAQRDIVSRLDAGERTPYKNRSTIGILYDRIEGTVNAYMKALEIQLAIRRSFS